MAFSKFNFCIFLLAFPLLLQTTFAADPLFHFCSSSENYTAKSPYQYNLNNLIGNLYIQTPQTGFGYGSTGQSSNQVFGLALCRGDVTTSDCKTCVVDASSEIRKRCPYNRAAIIWYDNCLVKYADNEFFGQIDNRNKFYMWNVREVSNVVEFNGKVKELLSKFAEDVYKSPKLYVSGETNLGNKGNDTLYGLVQCSRDLSNGDCKKCLDGIIGELPNCCNGKEGGRVVSGSCNFRYEIYPFVNA